MSEGSSKKKFLYINRKAPVGTIYALESLEVVLIGAAFEQDVSLAFLDDGVFQLMNGQDTAGVSVTPKPQNPKTPKPQNKFHIIISIHNAFILTY